MFDFVVSIGFIYLIVCTSQGRVINIGMEGGGGGVGGTD